MKREERIVVQKIIGYCDDIAEFLARFNQEYNLLKLPTCEIASRPRKISIQGSERTLCSQVWLETTP